MKNILLACLISITGRCVHAQQVYPGFAVVELFTSEGCSSCPPAEKILNRLIEDSKSKGKNIFCLEYHVDYWNRAGWKDPFSKNQFTRRQNNYSSILQQMELYTPQMIVNGETEFVGSQSDQADASVAKALSIPAALKLTIESDSSSADTLFIQYTSSQVNKNYSLHVALVENNLVSKISKGENSGKTLTHQAVVRIFYSFDLNSNTGMAKIPFNGTKLNAECKLIAFAQHKQTMKILGATEKKISPSLKQ